MRYVIWNNKGGVGKTFLTYCMAVEYAKKNPDKPVVVVDLCPQANISEMLLGGNGKGEEELTKLFDADRNIASYIKSRYDKSRFGKIGNEINFFTPVKSHNSQMPDNLYLLPGDTDLDICSLLIDYLASAPEKGAWLKSRNMLADLVETFEGEHKKECMVFIDCNPSFANYTQMGVVIADRIIVPCTADSASIRGIYNIFRLILGIKENSRFSESIFDTFCEKMKENGRSLPKIHSFILNKARTLDANATKAYTAHVKKIKEATGALYKNHEMYFTSREAGTPNLLDLKDGNTLAVVLNHSGLAPSDLTHKKYQVYGDDTQVNQSQIEPFLENLKKIVADL